MPDRIGLCLTGISHDNGKHLSGWKQKFKRSFLFTYENHYEKIINPYKKFSEVNVFFTTYNSELKNDLIDCYKPSSSLILNGYNHTMRSTYIKSIQNLINSSTVVDFYICTRFDIKFYNSLINWNFDYNKFNFLFKESWGAESRIEVSDVLFAFPKKYLEAFLTAIINADKNPRRPECLGELHYIYDFIVNEIGKENTHFITDELQSTAQATSPDQGFNSYFYLCRDET